MEAELLNVDIKFTNGRSVFGVVTREEMGKIRELLQKNAPSIEVNFCKTKDGPQTIVIPREQLERIDFY